MRMWLRSSLIAAALGAAAIATAVVDLPGLETQALRAEGNQLERFQVIHQDPSSAVIEIAALPHQAGKPYSVFLGWSAFETLYPVGQFMLPPGISHITVPSPGLEVSCWYTAVGTSFSPTTTCKWDSHWPDDPGDHF